MQRSVIRAAAAWYAQLESGEADAADRENWSRWRAAHPDHARAWQQVEELRTRLRGVPGVVSMATLATGDAPLLSRRAALRSLAAVTAGGGALWLASRQPAWSRWQADQRTAVGEQRELRLADGSRLLLDTATAVDIVFDAQRRLLRLHAGAVLVETARDTAALPRPFLVETAQGQLQALGTRFTVRADEGATQLTVIEHAVEVAPLALPQRLRVAAGQQLRFTRDTIGAVQASGEADSAWTRGLLIVSGAPLGEVVAELARYRAAPLVCDPAVAALRVSGAFPLREPELALSALTQSLPVRSVQLARWLGAPLIRVEARPSR